MKKNSVILCCDLRTSVVKVFLSNFTTETRRDHRVSTESHFSRQTLKQGVNEISSASLLFQRGLHNSFHLGHALFAEADEVLEDSAVAIDDELLRNVLVDAEITIDEILVGNRERKRNSNSCLKAGTSA